MMGIKYGVVEELFKGEAMTRKWYGIAGYADYDHCGTSSIVLLIGDITDDLDSITRLVNRCNKMQLSPEHLRDIVDDYISANGMGKQKEEP